MNKMESTDEIAAYFAGDLMVEKVRDIVKQLGDLDDAVRVEDLQSRLKTIREDSIRQLKDRQDLYEDGGDVIRLGNRRFAVNMYRVQTLKSGIKCGFIMSILEYVVQLHIYYHMLISNSR